MAGTDEFGGEVLKSEAIHLSLACAKEELQERSREVMEVRAEVTVVYRGRDRESMKLFTSQPTWIYLLASCLHGDRCDRPSIELASADALEVGSCTEQCH